MIKITSLRKVYKTKKKRLHTALDDINLVLPDYGLVFLLGKSGSGKSTLLNLIGGLDRGSSGIIEVDGNELPVLSENDSANYRNAQVGYIFQDYFLMDHLTVYENVALSLQLQGIKNIDQVANALDQVGLSNYADKYPPELSGGERQRVAIARAIVKNPRMILADEPTGNLDSDTAESIIELLGSFSKDRLVFVISHDKTIAHKYADRIIVLDNGRIISDRTKNPDFSEEVFFSDGELFCPVDKDLTAQDIFTINNYLAKGTRTIKRIEKYIDTQALEPVSQKIIIEKIRRVKNAGIQKEFLKPGLGAIVLRAFMVAIIITVFMLAQTITAFDPYRFMKSEFDNIPSNSVFLTKNHHESERNSSTSLNKVVNGFTRVEDSDIAAFQEAGYKGDIYKVLKCNLSIHNSQVAAGMATTIFEQSLFTLEPMGILLVDEAFIAEKFGEIEYLAKAEEFHPSGLIITDYLADIMLKSEHLAEASDYAGLIGEYHWGGKKACKYYFSWIYQRCYQNGLQREIQRCH